MPNIDMLPAADRMWAHSHREEFLYFTAGQWYGGKASAKRVEGDIAGNTWNVSEGSAGGNAEAVTAEGVGAEHPNAKELLAQLIGDEGFWTRARTAAGITEEDTEELILQKLEQCESLVLKSKAVCSLEALSLLPNLQSLVIDYDTWDNAQIEDFTPIAGLSRLEELYISCPAGENLDFSFLAGMDTITELFLVNCDLKDASFLGEMPQLKCLSLYQTPVADLAVLEKLTDLEELALYGNGDAKNIETVGKLLKMRDLGLQDCGIEDISFLSGLTQLRGVNLNYNSITDLTPLSELSGLERLGLVENEVSDLSPIAGLENLFDLALDGNRISDITALAALPHLNQAGLSGNQIRDFSPLADKPELLYASVLGNPCSDLEPLLLVPLLNFENGNVTEEQQRIVADWLKEQRLGVEEYECIDCVEADLDGDGLTDMAFVADGEFGDGDDTDHNSLRRLFILLRQKDGSFIEMDSSAIQMWDSSSGECGEILTGNMDRSGLCAGQTGMGKQHRLYGNEGILLSERRSGTAMAHLHQRLRLDSGLWGDSERRKRGEHLCRLCHCHGRLPPGESRPFHR